MKRGRELEDPANELGAVRRPRRRWLRRLAAGAIGMLALVLAVYGWAWVSLDRSSIARAMLWMEADVGDQHRFPARPIPADGDASPLPATADLFLPSVPVDVAGGGGTFDDLLRGTGTHAFLAVHSDRLVYERYFGPSDRQTLETSFSVAKSFLSTLVGVAVDEGLIGSVEDPVTDYLPELAARDQRFERITLRDLLTMSSGLRYREQELPLPWGDDIDTYYGTDLREVALSQTRIERPPGQDWLYNNYNPLLLGMVLERATGMSVSDYLASSLWQPMGAERHATWNLDSERSGFEKRERLQRDRGRLRSLRSAVPPRRCMERHADRLPRLGARRHDRLTTARAHPLRVLLVDRCRAAGALLRVGESRAIHLRGPRCGRRRCSLRSRSGDRQRHLAGRLPRRCRPTHARRLSNRSRRSRS